MVGEDEVRTGRGRRSWGKGKGKGEWEKESVKMDVIKKGREGGGVEGK